MNVKGAELSFWLVAIAYVLHKTPYVFPIVGGRKVEHLKQNVQALDISLSPEQIVRIDGAKPFDVGFPHNMIVRTLISLDCGNLADYGNREITQQILFSLPSCCNITTTVRPHKAL